MSTPEHDGLRDRLRAADPAPPAPSDPSWTDDLVEAAMTAPPTPARRTAARWLPAAAAAAAAVVALSLGAVALLGDGAEPNLASPPPPSETRLTLPGDEAMASCIRFSVEVLANAPVAFSGTATALDGEEVTLEVDRWYTGGDADVVRLVAPDTRLVPLIGGFEVEVGERYLITANRGAVNLCGFSGPWDPELAAAYEEAFVG